MAKTVLLTRKIQLRFNTSDPVQKKQFKDRLYHWQFLYFRAANHVLTHLFIQAGIQQLFYLEEGVQVKLANAAKDADGILNTSKENTTHRLLSRTFKGEIPVDFLTELNHRLTTAFNRDREAYLKGEKRMPNLRRDLSLQFKARSIRQVTLAEDKYNYCFCLYGIPFKTYLGREFSDKKTLLNAWAVGQLSLRDCALQLHKGKVFVKVVFEEPVTVNANGAAVAEVSLSLEYPLTVTIGKLFYKIGSKEEFLYRRLAIRAARRRVQASVTGARSGKGSKRKTKAVRSFAGMEKAYINYRLHVYSRHLIDLCVRKGVGTILLVAQQEKEDEARQDGFLLQNWSYFDLKKKIEYKATKVGITVIVE